VIAEANQQLKAAQLNLVLDRGTDSMQMTVSGSTATATLSSPRLPRTLSWWVEASSAGGGARTGQVSESCPPSPSPPRLRAP
jgi:hypothetical protein